MTKVKELVALLNRFDGNAIISEGDYTAVRVIRGDGKEEYMLCRLEDVPMLLKQNTVFTSAW